MSEQQKIVPAYMAHIVFQTKRYREMIEWYTKVFHAEPMLRERKTHVYDLRR